MTSSFTGRPTRALLALVVGLAVTLAACGDDDGESAQDTYCEAGESLESSVAALADVDLIGDGTNGLTSALEVVRDDAEQLGEAASDAAADEADALEASVDALGDAISDLAGDITADNATGLATAVQNVATAAEAVYATLSDC